MIFDFDDDNMIKFWMEGASPDPVLDIDNYDIHGFSGIHFFNNVGSVNDFFETISISFMTFMLNRQKQLWNC